MSVEPPPALLPALPLFADDPQHPWNRVHQILFGQARKVSQVGCLTTASCDIVPSPVGFFDGLMVDTAGKYTDSPTQLMSPGVDSLLTAARHPQAIAALHAALAIPPERQPVAAALLQNDLWERFDSIEHALADPDRDSDSRARLQQLRDGLGALIHHLALPGALLRAIPPNLPALVAQHPDVLAGLTLEPSPGAAAAPAWVEILERAAAMPQSFQSPMRDGSRHAMLAGYRAVFRVFASVPDKDGGAAWLQRQLASEHPFLPLPAGTRLAISEQPLAYSREGELTPLPLVTLLEARHVQPPPIALPPGEKPPVLRLSGLPFFLFEGKRQLLRAITPGQSGLLRLDAAAPFPQGGTCSPRPEVVQPLRSVCLMCHRPENEHLTGTMSHGEQRLLVASDPTAAARAVLDEKSQRSDFKSLRDYWKR